MESSICGYININYKLNFNYENFLKNERKLSTILKIYNLTISKIEIFPQHYEIYDDGNIEQTKISNIYFRAKCTCKIPLQISHPYIGKTLKIDNTKTIKITSIDIYLL